MRLMSAVTGQREEGAAIERHSVPGIGERYIALAAVWPLLPQW